MRKGDPFNFDEIYTSMGAGGLVKKSMAELKKPSTSPTTQVAASSGVVHVSSLGMIHDNTLFWELQDVWYVGVMSLTDGSC